MLADLEIRERDALRELDGTVWSRSSSTALVIEMLPARNSRNWSGWPSSETTPFPSGSRLSRDRRRARAHVEMTCRAARPLGGHKGADEPAGHALTRSVTTPSM